MHKKHTANYSNIISKHNTVNKNKIVAWTQEQKMCILNKWKKWHFLSESSEKLLQATPSPSLPNWHVMACDWPFLLNPSDRIMCYIFTFGQHMIKKCGHCSGHFHCIFFSLGSYCKASRGRVDQSLCGAHLWCKQAGFMWLHRLSGCFQMGNGIKCEIHWNETWNGIKCETEWNE